MFEGEGFHAALICAFVSYDSKTGVINNFVRFFKIQLTCLSCVVFQSVFDGAAFIHVVFSKGFGNSHGALGGA